MCLDPVSAALGVGSQVMSAYQNNKAQSKVISARNKALEADRQKQAALAAEAKGVNDNTLKNFTLQNQEAGRIAEAEKSLAVASGSDVAGDYVTGKSSEPSVVDSEIARQIGDAIRSGKTYARTSANLGSYGRQQFNNGVALTDGATNIDRINNFSRGNSALLPSQLAAANNKGSGNRLSSDLFGGIGDIALAYSMNGD